MVRLGCGIDPDWLGDLDGDDLRATDTLQFDEPTERVVQRSRLTFRGLLLDETVRPAEPGPAVSRLLADAALSRGAAAFDEEGALATLIARLGLLSQRGVTPSASGDVALDKAVDEAVDEATLRQILISACEGLRSFAELRQVPLTERVTAALEPRLRARLASEAPLSISLPGGRSVKVHYPADQPPWIESRLQDFFGMAKGPAIAAGRVPLTLHLLAPNGRAVQVTRDLDSFWRQHYPPVRRELGRRYPRHSWPEDGRTATPPPPCSPGVGPRAPAAVTSQACVPIAHHSISEVAGQSGFPPLAWTGDGYGVVSPDHGVRGHVRGRRWPDPNPPGFGRHPHRGRRAHRAHTRTNRLERSALRVRLCRDHWQKDIPGDDRRVRHSPPRPGAGIGVERGRHRDLGRTGLERRRLRGHMDRRHHRHRGDVLAVVCP